MADEMADEMADQIADDIADKMADEMADKMADKMADEMANEMAEMADAKVVVMHGAGIVTMDPQLRVFEDGGLVVKGSRILAMGRSGDILAEYASQADEVLDLSGGSRWILPGLVNTHVHTSQQLARGIADDVDLLTWLHDRIWPYESNMTEEDSYISTLLCGIELIRSGVTCFGEAGGQHVAGMARAVEALGIRACLARSTMDAGEGLPTKWATESTATCLQIQEDLFAEFNGRADDRIRVWFGLRQILNATDNLLLQTKELAAKYRTGIHMHVAEIPFENEWVEKTRNVKHGTVTFLNKLGLLDRNLLAAHSVWVNQSEVEMMAQKGVKVSHCPAAAMRMLGFAPISDMLAAGICVSLGTDGAPSNNRMSLVDEMYVASLINKGKVAFYHGVTDPTALPAETILKMSTINGSRSLLWDHEIGSLEAGKKADLVVVDADKWTMLPLHDPISSLVYCMRTENIASVMCNGQWIMREHKILTVDEADVIAKAKAAARDIMLRAGVQLPKRANMVI